MKIALTGHRPDKLNNEYNLDGPWSTHIRTKLQEIIDDLKPTLIISGMALGCDTIWALLAKANGIPLMACVPFPSQPNVWRKENRDLYYELLNYAELTGGVKITGTDPYTAWKMEVRNKYMVNEADVVIAVYNGDESGGTYNTVKYMKSIDKSMVRIDPNPNPQTNENNSEDLEERIRAVERLWDIPHEDQYSGTLRDNGSSGGDSPQSESIV